MPSTSRGQRRRLTVNSGGGDKSPVAGRIYAYEPQWLSDSVVVMVLCASKAAFEGQGSRLTLKFRAHICAEMSDCEREKTRGLRRTRPSK